MYSNVIRKADQSRVRRQQRPRMAHVLLTSRVYVQASVICNLYCTTMISYNTTVLPVAYQIHYHIRLTYNDVIILLIKTSSGLCFAVIKTDAYDIGLGLNGSTSSILYRPPQRRLFGYLVI